jgi:AraC family transcriptional activator of pobA
MLPTEYLRQEDHEALVIRPFDVQTPPTETHEPPHRHDFQEILWVRAGSGQQAIDGQYLPIQPQTFTLIARRQVHQLISGINLDGLVIRFADAFLPHAPGLTTGHYQMVLFNSGLNHNLPVSDEETAVFEHLLHQISSEYARRTAPGQYEILRHLLTVLLIKLEQVQNRVVWERGTAVDPDLHLFHQFTTLLEQQYSQTHAVQDYAHALSITPRHLSAISQRFVGSTAKQVIAHRLILEAKRQLTFTNHSIKEIAHALGFKDASYFSKAFKKQTAVAPQSYKGTL